jgi:dienelactone hydrolase
VITCPEVKRAVAVISGAVLALVIAGAGVAAWLRYQEPIAALPRQPPEDPAAVRELRRERAGDRNLLHVVLDGSAVGRIRFVVSLPAPLPAHPVPVVIVLGSLRGGSNAIRELTAVAGDLGPNAIVGFDWPLPRDLTLRDLALHAPALRRRVLSVPGQVDALLAWASQEPWGDAERVSLLGFSLGGFVVPAAQRLAEARGASIRWTVLAYAGAPIGAVIAGHPGVQPRWLASVLGSAADLLLRPVEPSFHLPHLRGRFLLLGAARADRLIAPAAAARMRELTPQPRTVVLIGGDHMGIGPDRHRLLGEVIRLTRSWLIEQGAIAGT